MAGLGPRVLQVLEFANARAPELQALQELSRHDAVHSRTDAKLETQKNQRRRRANAFKSYQMPQRLRATPKPNQSALRCRKHERRPHKLMQARSDTDSERPQWLSTHMWHTKRMTMTYMEAATAIAAACQEVVGDDEEGIEMHDRRGQLSRLKLRGRQADELMARLAGEVEIDEQDQEDEVSDHEDDYTEKETVAICSSSNRRNLLCALRNKKQTDKQRDTIYSVVVKDPRLTRYREGKLSHPSARSESGISLLKEPPAGAVPQVGIAVIESPLSGLSLSSLGKDAEEPETKMILKEMQALLAWTTSGSNVDNSKKAGSASYPIVTSKIQSEVETLDDEAMNVEVSPSSMLWSLSKRRELENNFLKDHQLNEEVYRQRKEGMSSNSIDMHVKSPPLHLLAIRKRGPYPHTSGWDLICPPSSAPGLLKAFPCDYPDTQAGRAYWKTRACDLETEQAKKPKSKRFNYKKHGVESPFQPRWELLFEATVDEDTQSPCVLRGEKYMKSFFFYRSSSTATEDEDIASGAESIVPAPMPTLVRVIVVVPRRGNVDVNAMLFTPSADDMEHFLNDKNWNGYDVVLSKKNKAGMSKTNEVKTTLLRSLIGYVTSAIYDRPKGAFRAVGFIACEPLQQLFLASQGQKFGKKGHYALAMLRTPQGRMVRPVLVQAEV
ncbi:hypothetical protein AM588_10007419 [Phytophthora nicotianae]|uniref:Uncharacterized protein n=1 Tax=Phytophthora nicotianae TaxID=4792 RepID=A0A0W8DFV8_PHYNI|nr:hypothetical protein AM588_10007419 [Phytophthora nicotianae]